MLAIAQHLTVLQICIFYFFSNFCPLLCINFTLLSASIHALYEALCKLLLIDRLVRYLCAFLARLARSPSIAF